MSLRRTEPDGGIAPGNFILPRKEEEYIDKTSKLEAQKWEFTRPTKYMNACLNMYYPEERPA